MMNKLAFFLFLAMATSVVTYAQEDDEYEEPSSTIISEKNYKRLLGAQELMGEEKYADALTRLQNMARSNLNDYERALVLQTMGFVYAQQGKYPEAIKYFEQCLALKALPSDAQQGMLYSLASLYLSQERYRETIATLKRWLKREPEPEGDAYIMMASSHANLKEYRAAIPHAQKAIELADEPKQPWYQLLLAMYFELKEFKPAVGVLNTMIGYWPDKLEYWEMLSGAYQELNDDSNAVAAMDLAYEKGLLAVEKKILNLVRMRLFVGEPYFAGTLLAAEIESGRIEGTEKNLRLLLNAWSTAKEYDKAVAVIEKLAPMTDDGKLYLTQSQIYLDSNRWDKVEAAVKKALDRGGLERPCKAHVQLGVAYIEQKKTTQARQAFQEASRFPRCRSEATSWLSYVNEQISIRIAADSGS